MMVLMKLAAIRKGGNIRYDCSNNTEQLYEGMICNLPYLSNSILFLLYLIK